MTQVEQLPRKNSTKQHTENSRLAVTTWASLLNCNVKYSNPPKLTTTRWFMIFYRTSNRNGMKQQTTAPAAAVKKYIIL
jgi:hypothetical protein